MKRRTALPQLALHCCLVLLAACGGGGDDEDANAIAAAQDDGVRVDLVDAYPDAAATAHASLLRPICLDTPDAPCGPQPLPTH